MGLGVQLLSDPDETGWGRKFLESCGVDPDCEVAVRTTYESCREAHGRWLFGEPSEMDSETYYCLVAAIEDLYGWRRRPWPLDWAPPIIVPLREPLKNTLSRTPGVKPPSWAART